MSDGEDLKVRISELREQLGPLLDDDHLRRIAEMERGQIMGSMKKIADLKDREEVTVEVEVIKINDTRQFTKKDGSQGRVRNIRVKDETGDCRVALWDDDVGLIEQLDIVEGSMLRCENCFVKHTDYGTDLTKGRKGSINKL